jgi:hypothetical protein
VCTKSYRDRFLSLEKIRRGPWGEVIRHAHREHPLLR